MAVNVAATITSITKQKKLIVVTLPADETGHFVDGLLPGNGPLQLAQAQAHLGCTPAPLKCLAPGPNARGDLIGYLCRGALGGTTGRAEQGLLQYNLMSWPEGLP